MIAVPKYALGRLSSQANNSMGYVRIFARAVSNPGPPDYSFDDIDTMPFTTLLSVQIASGKRHSIYVIKGCLVLVGKDIDLDVVSHQLEPYPYRRMCLNIGSTLVVWPGMMFQTVVVLKLLQTPAFTSTGQGPTECSVSHFETLPAGCSIKNHIHFQKQNLNRLQYAYAYANCMPLSCCACCLFNLSGYLSLKLPFPVVLHP